MIKTIPLLNIIAIPLSKICYLDSVAIWYFVTIHIIDFTICQAMSFYIVKNIGGLRNNMECCGRGSCIATKERKIDYLNLKEKAIIGTILASNLSRSI
jgi:hypothetical protein